MHRILIHVALVCAMCCASARAEAPPTAAIGWPWSRAAAPLAISNTPHPAVARITVIERDGLAFGSGTLVDVEGDQGLVITNWHVVRDATGDITVQFPDGFRSQAKVMKVDRDWDLAALTIWKPLVPPVRLAPTAPQPGEALTIAGYGSGNFRAATARCTQYVSPGKNLPFEMVEVGVEARQGDSGGPILNQRGEIAGVLFGAGGGTTSGSYVGRVRTFIAAVSPRLADPNFLPPSQQQLASTNPFVNPSGAVRQVSENMAVAQPSSAPPPLQPITTAATAGNDANDGWRVAANAHHAAQPGSTPGESERRPVELSASAADRIASRPQTRATQITFGSLPEQIDAPAPATIMAEAVDGQLPLWSRPLPQAQPAITANANNPLVTADPSLETPSAATTDPADIVRSFLGDTWLDQGKSLFALLGVVLVFYQLVRTPQAS
jgi:hypothetical protein